jgi:hypothetical protein
MSRFIRSHRTRPYWLRLHSVRCQRLLTVKRKWARAYRLPGTPKYRIWRVAHFSGEYTLSREPLAAKMKGVPHFSWFSRSAQAGGQHLPPEYNSSSLKCGIIQTGVPHFSRFSEKWAAALLTPLWFWFYAARRSLWYRKVPALRPGAPLLTLFEKWPATATAGSVCRSQPDGPPLRDSWFSCVLPNWGWGWPRLDRWLTDSLREHDSRPAFSSCSPHRRTGRVLHAS